MGAAKNQQDAKRDAARSKRSKTSGRLSFNDYRFVRVELSASERTEFGDLLEGGEYGLFDLLGFIEQGYKVSISTNPKDGTVQGHVSCQDPDHIDRGLILSAFGPDTVTVVALLAYKHLVLCGEDGWRAAEERRGGAVHSYG